MSDEDKQADGGWLAVIVPSVVSGVIGAVAAYFVATNMAPQNAGTPTVIMDTSAWMQSYDSDSNDATEASEMADEVQGAAIELRSRGYIVLYPESVMQAPTSVKIGPDEARAIISE